MSLVGDWISLKIVVKPPVTFGVVHAGRFGLGAGPPPAHVRLSVAPVSSEYSSLKLESARSARFSGRLIGVAPAILSSAVTSAPGKGVVAVVALTGNHLALTVLPTS